MTFPYFTNDFYNQKTIKMRMLYFKGISVPGSLEISCLAASMNGK